jgi:hypothetical protein
MFKARKFRRVSNHPLADGGSQHFGQICPLYDHFRSSRTIHQFSSQDPKLILMMPIRYVAIFSYLMLTFFCISNGYSPSSALGKSAVLFPKDYIVLIMSLVKVHRPLLERASGLPNPLQHEFGKPLSSDAHIALHLTSSFEVIHRLFATLQTTKLCSIATASPLSSHSSSTFRQVSSSPPLNGSQSQAIGGSNRPGDSIWSMAELGTISKHQQSPSGVNGAFFSSIYRRRAPISGTEQFVSHLAI